MTRETRAKTIEKSVTEVNERFDKYITGQPGGRAYEGLSKRHRRTFIREASSKYKVSERLLQLIIE